MNVNTEEKYISPFDPICNEIAVKFDNAEISHDLEKTRSLLNEAEDLLKEHDEPSYAPLFYSVATSLIIIRNSAIKAGTRPQVYLSDEVIKLHGEALWYYRHAEELLDEIEPDEKNKPYLNGILLELYVNLGNAYSFCNRECMAMEYYSKALDIYPGFGMALGNMGHSLIHYAQLDGDPGHQSVLVKKAYLYYRQALLDDYPATYQEAKDGFAEECTKLEASFGKDMLNSLPEYIDEEEDQSKEEKIYRQWCLEYHLFLNTLNDLPELNRAFETDPLQIDSITTSVKQKEQPYVFEMFNQIKEEYVYARYMLFEACNSDYEVSFADKETHLNDPLKYCDYSIRLEKLKTSFRTLYSLLDRIAYLLNAYFDLGIAQDKVSFDRIWESLKSYECRNAGLYALHWINRDFKEKYGSDDSAYTKKLKDLRNALEHKIVAIHSDKIEDLLHKPGKDYIFRISEEHMFEYTMFLIKIVREAIIEMTTAIRIEEHHRQGYKDHFINVPLREYRDDFKR